jgi:hypothetical protein
MTHYIRDSANNGPWVHDALSARDQCLRLKCAIIKPSDHFTSDYLSVFFQHLKTHSKDHEHMVDSVDAHRVDVTQSVAASDATLHVGVVYKGVEEICR